MGTPRSRKRCTPLITSAVRQGALHRLLNYAAWQLMKALWIADREGVHRSSACSTTTRCRLATSRTSCAAGCGPGPRHPRLEPDRRRPAVGQIPPAWSGRRRGVVTSLSGVSRLYDEDKLYDTIEELVAIADHGVSAAQIALAYTMGKPAVTSVIVGAHRGAACRQPLGRRPDAVGEEVDRPTRPRAAAALPVLAPGQQHERPAQPCRSHAASASHQGLTRSACNEPSGRSRATSSPRLRTPTLVNIDFR